MNEETRVGCKTISILAGLLKNYIMIHTNIIPETDDKKYVGKLYFLQFAKQYEEYLKN